jgi:hypothetical protein
MNKAKELIEAYEAIIFGDKGMGLINDYYYHLESYLDNEIEHAKHLKKELNIEEIAKEIWDNMEAALSNQIHTRNPEEMKSLEEEIMDYSIEYKDNEDYDKIVGAVYGLYEKRFNNQ